MFRVVRLGEHKVRKARRNVADAHVAADVFIVSGLFCYSLAVMDFLESMVHHGVSLSRSVELTVQWDKILAAGPLYPVALEVFGWQGLVVLGSFIVLFVMFITGSVTSSMGLLFIVGIEATRGWRNWLREDPFVHPF